jgi:hypothetical protein
MPRIAHLVLTIAALTAAPALAQPTTLPIDKEAVVAGIGVGCTGIGQTRLEGRWQAYPVRVEFSNALSEYLTDGELTVSRVKGGVILSVKCAGPWILLKLPAGNYRVEGRVPGGKAKSANVKPPAHGQSRVVLQFPEL